MVDEILVFVGCYDGNLYCLSFEDGRVLGQFQTNAEIKSSPRAVKGKYIALGSHDHHFYVLKVEKCEESVIFGMVLKDDLGAPVFSSPAVSQREK